MVSADATPLALDPPDDLPPGLTAVLLEGKVRPHAHVATLLDLAERGFITFEAAGGGWRLHRLAPFGELRSFERTLVDSVLDRQPEARFSEARARFPTARESIERAYFRELERRELFKPRAGQRGYDRRTVVTGGSLLTVLDIAMLALAALVSGVFLWLAVGVTLLTIGFYVIERLIPQRTAQGVMTTAAWSKLRKRVAGALAAPPGAPESDVSALFLPYVVAFRLTEPWLARYGSTTQPPHWLQTDAATSGAALATVLQRCHELFEPAE